MGSMDSAFGGSSFGDGFEPDDFYESFLAPKFHDFTAPEEPIDPDAYFMAKPGMLKKAFATVEDVKPAAAKSQKDASKTVAAQVPPKSPIAAEKTAASTGSAKKATRVVATSVTPLASKPQLKNSPMQEKHNNNAANTASNGSLKPTSLAKKLQASENDDPNSPTNNSSGDVAAAPKPAKQQQQRSVKAQEEKPAALTRQRSIKAHQEESKPAALTRQRSQKVLETKPIVERKASVESNTSKEKAKTPVKEPAAEAAAVGSGHHCKSSRCAANDPNFASPVPTKKYLVAKKGTPGSLRKAETETTAADDVKVVKVALEDVFQKIALDPEVLSSSEVKGLKEVPLQEEKAAISGDEIREWVGRPVSLEGEKAVVSEKCTEVKKEEQKEIESFLKVASECLENIDLETLAVPPISKQGKKRKSGELIAAGSSKRANCTSDENRNKAISKKISQVNQQAAAAASSKIPNKLRMRRLSVAKRLSIARSGSRVTNPRPFRLRTQERGAMKEKEFIKKMEEYKAAKEGFHSAFQGLAIAEPKIPAKFLKPGHVFSAKRAELPKPPQDDEPKAMNKAAGLPPAHKAPLFDHPFKPHRSTKKLTVPQEPKFHSTRGSRNCPSHHAVAV